MCRYPLSINTYTPRYISILLKYKFIDCLFVLFVNDQVERGLPFKGHLPTLW